MVAHTTSEPLTTAEGEVVGRGLLVRWVRGWKGRWEGGGGSRRVSRVDIC